jgi:hypothetical protein
VSADKVLSKCSGTLRGAIFYRDPYVIDKENNANYKVFYLQKGKGFFTNVGVRCLPTAYMAIGLSTTLRVPYFDTSGPNPQFKFKLTSFRNVVNVTFRTCGKGEIFDLFSVTQSSCSKCIGSYSLRDNGNFDTVSFECIPCPKEASYCSGDQIVLKPGYWRPNNRSTKIYSCLSTTACVGGNTSNVCRSGYGGPLCGLCQPGMHLTGDNECESCSDVAGTLRSGGIFAIVIVILIAVYSRLGENIKESLNDDFVSAVLTKVVESYQILLLGLGNFPSFKSTDIFSKLAGFFKIVNLDFASIISLQCFMSYNYYSSLKFYLIVPSGVSILLASIGYFSSSSSVRIRFFSFIVRFLYFCIPLIASSSLQIFKCVEVNDTESRLIADLTIICKGKEYEFYTAWAFLGVFFSAVFIPLCLWTVLFTRRRLIASASTIEIYKSIIKHSKSLELQLSLYYDVILPFESLYGHYRPQVWWYNIFSLVVSLFLSSVAGVLIKESRNAILISILVIIATYILQGHLRPYVYSLENTFSYYSTFHMLVIFICVYFIEINGLGDKFVFKSMYDKLDIFMVSCNLLFLLMATCCIYIHLKAKKQIKDSGVSLISKADKNEDSERLAIASYGDTFDLGEDFTFDRFPWKLEIFEKARDKDLLAYMGVFFFRLAPRGTYSNMKAKYDDVGNVIHSFHVEEMVPSFIIDPSENNRGSLTIFSRSRGSNENLMKIIFRGGVKPILYGLMDIFKLKLMKLFRIKKKVHATGALTDPDEMARRNFMTSGEASLRFIAPSSEEELLENMSIYDFIENFENIMFGEKDDILKITDRAEDRDCDNSNMFYNPNLSDSDDKEGEDDKLSCNMRRRWRRSSIGTAKGDNNSSFAFNLRVDDIDPTSSIKTNKHRQIADITGDKRHASIDDFFHNLSSSDEDSDPESPLINKNRQVSGISNKKHANIDDFFHNLSSSDEDNDLESYLKTNKNRQRSGISNKKHANIDEFAHKLSSSDEDNDLESYLKTNKNRQRSGISNKKHANIDEFAHKLSSSDEDNDLESYLKTNKNRQVSGISNK